ncbi:MAG TPA: BlaI/MecI/CopY family transcriptional regulator [Actinospica sp.]|nr:BlaI/MecI/CopY family transcriptional regulator [Actinospica sp.]
MAPLRKARDAETARATRRAHGTLESAVLAILWDAGGPLNPGEVRERLAGQDPGAGGVAAGEGELAYTTVVTILTRLHDKGALSREREGRAYRYAPVADEAGLAARRLAAMLDAAPDRRAVLSRFVEDLGDHDEQLLRGLLDARVHQPAADLD